MARLFAADQFDIISANILTLRQIIDIWGRFSRKITWHAVFLKKIAQSGMGSASTAETSPKGSILLDYAYTLYYVGLKKGKNFMSLNKKYTWARFLKEHPEHKEKKTKRTSKEGQKAFDAAFKQHAKEYLKERLAKIEKEQKTAAGTYLARLERDYDRTKTLQKNI